MTEWVLTSSILILIVIALRTCFKGKISLRLQYAIWGLVLLRLLVPVSFGSTDISVANLVTLSEMPSIEVQPEKHVNTVKPNHPELQPHAQSEQVSLQIQTQMKPVTEEKRIELRSDVFDAIWAVGAICVASLFLVANIRFRKRIERSRRAMDVRKNNLVVYTSGAIDTPCLFGVTNPAIYVTYSVAEDPTLLRHTLEHEATHYRHGDHIWVVLRCICLAIHWYNPLVWWAAFLSQRDGELACDEATIQRLGEGERAEYGRTLISMTCRKKANVLITATTMTTGKSGIKERILLIARKPKMALYTLAAVLLTAAVAVGCTFTGAKDNTADDLTGTNVFASESEVTGMAIHALPDGYRLVDSEHPSEMTQWVLDFQYGESIDSNEVMDPGSNTFSVTVYFADGTEQTCAIDYETVNDVTYVISRETVPACWDEIWDSESEAEDFPDNVPPVNQPEPFSKEPDDDKVCIAVLPTGVSVEGGDYRYIIPEDQTVLLEYYTAASASAHIYTQWDSSLKRSGWWIVYQDQWWQVTEGGAMFGTDPETWEGICIDAEDAGFLYEFCDAAVKEAGIGEPVRPEDLTGIKSATLDWNGIHTVTDEYALNKIETWLSTSRESGSVSCWFTAGLTLELENGETKTITMATDDCAYYLSEGVAYGFGEITEDGIGGNEEFYSLFAPSVIHEKLTEGSTVITDIDLFDYLTYLNWSRYANQYGVDDTFALMEAIEKWAAEEPGYERFGSVIRWSVGLDGAYADSYGALMARLYELDKAGFAWACMGNATSAEEESTLSLLAYHWNVTSEEARAKLEAELPQN